jgi:hypothetical protein
MVRLGINDRKKEDRLESYRLVCWLLTGECPKCPRYGTVLFLKGGKNEEKIHSVEGQERGILRALSFRRQKKEIRELCRSTPLLAPSRTFSCAICLSGTC